MCEETEWVGFDLDGTLALSVIGKVKPYPIGDPIPEMVAKLKAYRDAGWLVKIFTARVAYGPESVASVQEWCRTHIGQAFEVTDRKTPGMRRLFDDRCVQVERNTGRVLGDEDQQY